MRIVISLFQNDSHRNVVRYEEPCFEITNEVTRVTETTEPKSHRLMQTESVLQNMMIHHTVRQQFARTSDRNRQPRLRNSHDVAGMLPVQPLGRISEINERARSIQETCALRRTAECWNARCAQAVVHTTIRITTGNANASAADPVGVCSEGQESVHRHIHLRQAPSYHAAFELGAGNAPTQSIRINTKWTRSRSRSVGSG